MVKTLHPIGDISTSISRAGGRRVRLTCECDALSAANGAPGLAKARQDESAFDPVAAVIRALAEPLGFPPLAAATVPGDHVAIALDEGVPRAASIVRGAFEAFQSAGVESEAISIVSADADTARLCRAELENGRTNPPQFVVHDPEDAVNLCLAGTARHGEPLLVNRTIFDADVVLPIGVARLDGHSVYESLFPRFSDAAAIARYRTPTHLDSAAHVDQAVRETDEAGWLIGAPMVVQVVPGADETVAHVVAGEPDAVAQRAQQLYRQRWSFHSARRVSLVVATVGGGAPAQTWGNIGRALATAEHLLEDGGAVAICSNIERPIGESLGRLIGARDLGVTERKILHDQGEDSWPAWQLSRALQRGPVYFLSQLDDETVEDMGLAPIADIGEVVRLAGRYESCVVIEDSQHAVVTVDGEENE